MRRAQLALMVVIAVLLVWGGMSRDTSAARGPVVGGDTGRYTLSLAAWGAGERGVVNGYYAILLDTRTGQMWSSSGPGRTIGSFVPLKGPLDRRMSGTEKPATQPGL